MGFSRYDQRARRRPVSVGWPIAHSRSPLIHSYWLRNAWESIRRLWADRRAGPANLPPSPAASDGDGLVGANVTAPHKEAAFAACDRLTASAAELGAVNTLWRARRRLVGRQYSNVAGFLANLDEQAPGVASENQQRRGGYRRRRRGARRSSTL